MAIGILIGICMYVLLRCVATGFYTVGQNERAVKTIFGRAERIGDLTTIDDPISESLDPEARERYIWPQVRVIPPGGPYFKWPWEDINKVSIATQTVSIAFDPESTAANNNNTVLEAVTKDQLNTGLAGQIRYTVAERNLYANIFGIINPIAHIMGYYISVLRERIANFEGPPPTPGATSVPPHGASLVQGISINDLRKNMRDLNEHIESECLSSSARYGIRLDAALITSIDPPAEVESALAAINTAYNQVSSEISVAQAAADQKIVQSRRAVEIETLRAQAEVEPLNWLAAQLGELKKNGEEAVPAYLRNIRLELYRQAKHIFLETKK
jgi:regulator of protease activity HflC (stomatin/prohibitin superfamily)